MGQAGVDIRLVGDALKKFPWSVECKNKECWAVHQWILQAKHQKKDGTDWLVIAKKNFQDPVVILDADVFFKLLGRIKDV
jgi:Asp/Glu/hydantoin racemase